MSRRRRTCNQVQLGVDVLENRELKTASGHFTMPAAEVFEIADYSFDIEQTMNIGSSSSGAGAGQVTFNPFTITRQIDSPTPIVVAGSPGGLGVWSTK